MQRYCRYANVQIVVVHSNKVECRLINGLISFSLEKVNHAFTKEG